MLKWLVTGITLAQHSLMLRTMSSCFGDHDARRHDLARMLMAPDTPE
jgi:hypothetical protein